MLEILTLHWHTFRFLDSQLAFVEGLLLTNACIHKMKLTPFYSIMTQDAALSFIGKHRDLTGSDVYQDLPDHLKDEALEAIVWQGSVQEGILPT